MVEPILNAAITKILRTFVAKTRIMENIRENFEGYDVLPVIDQQSRSAVFRGFLIELQAQGALMEARLNQMKDVVHKSDSEDHELGEAAALEAMPDSSTE